MAGCRMGVPVGGFDKGFLLLLLLFKRTLGWSKSTDISNDL